MSFLHRDPAALRAAALEIEALLPALRVPPLDPDDLTALSRAPGGARLVAEHDRLAAAVARSGGELAGLLAGLGAVVAATESAERDAVDSVRAVDR